MSVQAEASGTATLSTMEGQTDRLKNNVLDKVPRPAPPPSLHTTHMQRWTLVKTQDNEKRKKAEIVLDLAETLVLAGTGAAGWHRQPEIGFLLG